MKTRILTLLLILSSLVIMGQGCPISFNRGADDGGVFRSTNKGDDWERKVALLSVSEPQTIGNVNVNSFELDPSDSNTLYAATNRGVFVSYDNANSWMQIRPLAGSNITDIAVDPKDKCNIYTAIGNQIYKSEDCGRNFGRPIYNDPRTNNRITGIDIDSFNPMIIYAGTSEGDLIKSLDGGKSWKTINRFNNEIMEVLIDQDNDTRIVYVGTRNRGVWRTIDAGGEWESSEDVLREYPGGLEFREMVYHKNRLVLATKYGLFMSAPGDEWANWQPIDLIEQPGTVFIRSLAMSPQNPDEIYYGTDTTFYRTTDGGRNWSNQKLPTSRSATALAVHLTETNVIYMGVTKFEE